MEVKMTHVANELKQKTIPRKKTMHGRASKERKTGKHKIPNPYNIGFLDRSLRFIVGGAMLGSVLTLSPTVVVSIFGYEMMLLKVLTFLSLYPLLTAWIGLDPIYHILSIDSATKLKEDKCADIVDQVKTAVHLDS
jgi:hypothetical protein